MKEEVPKPVTVHFVLQESSGYMEPMLCILAILHTVISFFCIIGYYCLKVGHIDERKAPLVQLGKSKSKDISRHPNFDNVCVLQCRFLW